MLFASSAWAGHPQERKGFWIGGGGGCGSAGIDCDNVTASLDKWGWGALAGVGYDIRAWRNVSITPSVQYSFGGPGDLTFEGDDVIRGFKHDVVDVTIGVTFH